MLSYHNDLWSLPFRFSDLYALHIPSMCATRHAHPILLDDITLIIQSHSLTRIDVLQESSAPVVSHLC